MGVYIKSHLAYTAEPLFLVKEEQPSLGLETFYRFCFIVMRSSLYDHCHRASLREYRVRQIYIGKTRLNEPQGLFWRRIGPQQPCFFSGNPTQADRMRAKATKV
jgi:hypothetical protein